LAGCAPVDLSRERRVQPAGSRHAHLIAGIWTGFKGDRGTKSKPAPGPHLVYGFLTTDESATYGCARRGMKQRHCSGRCRMMR
jgi:hypothetical protein